MSFADLLARFDLSGRWQRLMPSLYLPSNASLEEAQDMVKHLVDTMELQTIDSQAKKQAIAAADAALRDCQERLQAANALPGAVPGPSVLRPPLPSFDGHHLNHYWTCLWERREPIPVWLMPDCPVEPLEIAVACDLWDSVAAQVTGGRLSRFMVVRGRAMARPDYGLVLYGPGSAANSNFLEVSNHRYYPPVATRRYAARDPQPTRAEPMREQLRYCLEIRAADYTSNAMAHELGHVLGLADHYFSIESDAKEGLWPVLSIMGNVDLGVTAHDIEDLTALYGAALLRSL